MGERATLEVDGGPVEVTSLNDVVYPVTGFRKGEVLDYYVKISDHLLPHLRERPIKLKLFWEGTMHPPRDERDAPPDFLPKWIETAEIARAHEDADMEFALVNDLRSLLWLVNHKNYEFHPFLAKASNLRSPSGVVFDLDPGHPADVLDAAQVALHLKKALDALKLKSFVKSTGSKGLHVYVPLNTPTTYDNTASFARQVAEQLECAFPELVVSKMAKLVRAGKVFVDWSQNEYFKSTVAVYSMRATTSEPFIAAPVTWAEVATAVKRKKHGALRFLPDEVLKRVKKDGDIFAPVLTLKQRLPRTAQEEAKTAAAASFDETSVPVDPIEPMECKQLKQPSLPDPAHYVYDVKHDGYRCIAVKQKNKVVLFSREGTVFNTAYPNIVEAVQMLRPDSFVIDGEIVAHDGKGNESFIVLQNIATFRVPLHFHIFDVLWLSGENVMKRPLSERRALLEKTFKQQLSTNRVPLNRVHLVKTVDMRGDIERIVARLRKAKAHGIVAKKKDSSYVSGERGEWLKLKFQKSDDFVIGGYIGLGSVDELIVGQYKAGKLMFVEAVKAGFNPTLRRDVLNQIKHLKTDQCPFVNLPEKKAPHAMDREKMSEAHWLKPEMVAEIGYDHWTVHHHLRHSKFKWLRPDKSPKKCVMPDDLPTAQS